MITKATRDRQRDAETTREREIAELARVRWLLNVLLVDCIDLDRNRRRTCRHCHASAGEIDTSIAHEASCVVGQILRIRQQEKL